MIDGFEDWLTPAQALDLLPLDEWGSGHCIDAIITNLKIGALRAVARHGLLATGDPRTVEFHQIPAGYWDDGLWVRGSEALWVTGQVSFHRGSKLGELLGHHHEEWIEHVFSGVRFDPIGFASTFSLDVAGAGRPVTETRRPIAAAEMERFARLYLDLWGEAATEMKALSAIRACYPDAVIGRDAFLSIFRELRGPGKVGKPRKNDP